MAQSRVLNCSVLQFGTCCEFLCFESRVTLSLQRLAHCGDLDGLAFYRAVRGDQLPENWQLNTIFSKRSTSFAWQVIVTYVLQFPASVAAHFYAIRRPLGKSWEILGTLTYPVPPLQSCMKAVSPFWCRLCDRFNRSGRIGIWRHGSSCLCRSIVPREAAYTCAVSSRCTFFWMSCPSRLFFLVLPACFVFVVCIIMYMCMSSYVCSRLQYFFRKRLYFISQLALYVSLQGWQDKC